MNKILQKKKKKMNHVSLTLPTRPTRKRTVSRKFLYYKVYTSL